MTFWNNLKYLKEVNIVNIAKMTGKVAISGKFKNNIIAKKAINESQATMLALKMITEKQVLALFIEDNCLIGFNVLLLETIILPYYEKEKKKDENFELYIGSSVDCEKDKHKITKEPDEDVIYVKFDSNMVKNIELKVDQEFIESVMGEMKSTSQ